MAVGGGMGRLLGLGFVFGARDNGAVRTTTSLADGMDRVADSSQEAARQSSALNSLGESIARLGSAGARGIESLGNNLESLANATGLSSSSSSIESFGVEFSNTWRRATVGLGPFRDEVEGMRGEISGLAYSLDVDAGEMIGAVTNLARSGHSLDDFGISLRTVAGSIQANILSGTDLTTLLTGLSEGYELGAEGATALVDQTTAIGEAFGFGADAVRRLPSVIAAADPILARFSGMSINEVTDSVTRLSTAMARGLGISFDDASEAATGLLTSLGDARSELSELIVGTGSDMPELATALGISMNDIDGSMRAIMSDPLTFTQRMRDLLGGMDDNSVEAQRLRSILAGLGTNFAFASGNGEEMGRVMEAARAPIADAEGAFNRMARSGAGTSRTFSESMERMREGFEASLRGISSVTNREVLHNQREAYDRLESRIRDFAGRGGATGLLTQAVLNVREYGLVNGLLPMLDEDGPLGRAFPRLSARIREVAPWLGELGSGFAEAAQSAGPMLMVLGQTGLLGLIPRLGSALVAMGGSVMTAIGPVGIAIAAIAAAAAIVIYNWDDISNFFETTDWAGMSRDAAQGFLDGLDWLSDMSGAIRSTIELTDWNAVGQAIGDGFRDAWSFVSGLFSGEFNENVTGFIRDSFGMDPSAIVPYILTSLHTILQNTLGQLDTIFHEIVSGIFGDDSMWVDLFDTMFAISPLGAIQRALDADNITDGIIAVLGAVLGPGAALYSWAYDTVNGLWEDIFGESLMDSFLGIPDMLLGVVDGVLAVMLWPFEQVFGGDRISELFHQGGVMAIFDDFVSFVGATFDAMGDIWDDIIVPMGEVAWEILGEVGSAFSELWTETVAPVLEELRSWWDDQFGGEVVPDARQNIRSTGDSFRSMWQQTIRPALIAFARTAIQVMMDFERTSMAVWQVVGTVAVRTLFSVIRTISSLRVNFEQTREVLMAGWQAIGARIRRFFVEPILEAGDSFMTIFETIDMTIRGMRLGFLGIVQSLVMALQSAFNSIPEVIRDSLGISGDVMGGAVSSIGTAVAEETAAIRTAREGIAAARLERQASMAAERSRTQEAEAALAAAIAERRRAIDTEEARVSGIETRTLVGIAGFGARMDGALVRASERVENMGETLEGVAEDAAGVVTTEDGTPVVVAREGEESAPVVARTTEEAPGEGAGRTGGARRARERRMATEAAADADRTETARATAREMVISAFGTEAVRQLGAALGGGGGGGGRGRARRSEAGGSPESVGG